MIDAARRGDTYDGGDQGVINRCLDLLPGFSACELDACYKVMVIATDYGD
jgi:hypothetical protein